MNSQQKETILAELKDALFAKHDSVSCNFVSKKYQIHISEAIKLLEEFASKHSNDRSLSIQYLLSGSDDSEESHIGLQRFSIVDKNELKSSKPLFTNPTYHIYAVNYVGDGVNATPALNFEQFIYEPNLENVNKVQSLSYIHNSQIGIRPARREVVTKILKHDAFTNGGEVSHEIKQETKPDEPMEIDVEKPASPSPKKRSNSNEEVRRYKRIRVMDSDDEDESIKMKENGNSKVDNDFKVTKLEKVDDDFKVTKLEKVPDTKPVKCVPNDEKKKNNEAPKPKPKQNGALKPKQTTQTSITSFFKRPPK